MSNITEVVVLTNSDSVQCSFLATIQKQFSVHSLSRMSSFEMFGVHKLHNFLHSDDTYAVIHLPTGNGSYWLKGKEVKAEEAKKVIKGAHNREFNNDFLNIIGDING